MESEKRKFERRAIDREVMIEADGLIIRCDLLDVSRSGARLRTVESGAVPQQFVLNLSDRLRPPARIAWRTGNEIGVEFTGGAPPPADGCASREVYIRCPDTGRDIQTEIVLASEGDLAKLARSRRFTRCPYCKVLHGWFPSEALLK